MLNRIRAFAHHNPIGRLLLHERVRPILGALAGIRFVPAAWTLTTPWHFLWRAARKAGPTDYRLRDGDVLVVIDHRQGGLEMLDEIIRRRCYDPPADLVDQIGTHPVIIDAGANVGVFSAFAASRWPHAQITAIEPDPSNLAALRHLAAAGGDGRITVVAAAATDHEGSTAFAAGHGSASYVAEGKWATPDSVSVAAVDLVAMTEQADFCKIDIERGEWPILADARLDATGPLVIVMEYHRRDVDDYDALDDMRALCEARGFQVGHVRANYWGHGTLWAWRH